MGGSGPRDGTGYEGKVENARGYALVWSGPGIRTFTATGDRPVAGARADALRDLGQRRRLLVRPHEEPLPGRARPALRRARASSCSRSTTRAVAHCRDGADLPELDRLVRAGIAEAGYPGQPSHPIAHGVGARAHEPPYAHQAGSGTIRKGMVLAIEPGIYWEGGGGLRVEDNWLITDGAPEKLCSLPGRDRARMSSRTTSTWAT